MKRIITVVCICSCLADNKDMIYIHIKMKLQVEERIFSLRTIKRSILDNLICFG